MTDRYYAIDVAAVATGKSVRQIERWIKDGVIASFTAAGVVYVTIESVEGAPERAKRHGYTKLARYLTDKPT
jgi:hypothetical protein